MMKQIKFMIFTIYIVSKFLILFSLPVDQVLEVHFDFKNVCNFFICRNEIIITRNKTVHFRQFPFPSFYRSLNTINRQYSLLVRHVTCTLPSSFTAVNGSERLTVQYLQHSFNYFNGIKWRILLILYQAYFVIFCFNVSNELYIQARYGPEFIFNISV